MDNLFCPYCDGSGEGPAPDSICPHCIDGRPIDDECYDEHNDNWGRDDDDEA